jgi:hypothetical protein
MTGAVQAFRAAKLAGTLLETINPLKGVVEGFKNFRSAFQDTTEIIEDAQGPIDNLKTGLGDVNNQVDGDLPNNLNKSADGMKNAGESAGSTWKNILAFGAAVLFVGVGIGAAAWGVAQLAEAFANPSWGQLGAVAAVLVLFAAGIFVLGTASFEAAPGLGALALAVLGIGAGIGLAAAGVGYMAEKLGTLGENIGPVALAFAGLTGAMAAFLLMMANPLSLLGLATFAASLGGIMYALNQLPEEKAIALNTTLDNFDKIGKSGANISATIDEIKGAVEAYVSIKDTPDDEVHKKFLEVIEAIKGSTTGGRSPAQPAGGGQPIPIVLEVDGFAFAKGVLQPGLSKLGVY